METIPLEHIIRTYATLDDRPNHKGFWPVLCRICHDHGRKGKRAGFNFSGNVVGYHCFNCGHSARFDPTSDVVLSRDMTIVMNAWNIPEVDWLKAISVNAIGRGNIPSQTSTSQVLRFPQEIAIPDHFYYLRDDKSDLLAQAAIEYLENRRICWTQHPYMLSTGTSAIDEHATRWKGRLIIPHYANRKLIFWQGRDMLDIRMKKYLSPDVPREAIIGGFDRLFTSTDDPLFITEGWFDCEPFNGCCMFSNRMTLPQIEWLNRSPRRKIVIPDKFQAGMRLAQQAIQLGWEISTPDIGTCTDINSAVAKYGTLYVKKTVLDSISSGFDAQINLGLYTHG